MKKNWSKIALVLGPMIMIASTAWEYARLKPDYNFLIQPWSLRGYETRQGWAILAMGVLLVIGGLLSAWEGSIRPAVSAGVTMFLVAAATGVAALFTIGTDRAVTNLTLETVSGLMISALLAASVSLSLRSMFRDKSVVFKRAMPVFVVLFVVFGLVASTVTGTQLAIQTWALVLIVFLAMAGLSISIRPIDVAANRMIIFTTVAAWA